MTLDGQVVIAESFCEERDLEIPLANRSGNCQLNIGVLLSGCLIEGFRSFHERIYGDKLTIGVRLVAQAAPMKNTSTPCTYSAGWTWDRINFLGG